VFARRIAITLAGAVAAVSLALLALKAHSTSPGDCDNIAGTCLRHRQQLALGLLFGLYSTAAGVCLWIGTRAARGATTPTSHIALLSAGIALVVAAALLDPAGHLDNRYHGWLA
jgi:hypothetical protein